MAYLTFNSMQKPYNESLATMGRQMVDGVKQLFDTDTWTSERRRDTKYLENKKTYFDSMYKIDGELKRKLIAWIKKIPGVFYLPEEEMHQFLHSMDQHQETSGYYNDGSGGMSTYTVTQTKILALQRKARTTNRMNSITNATCVYPLKVDNKQCVLFFTFDSNKIHTAQVLTQNKYSKGMTTEGFDVVEIPEFDNVQKSEYTKMIGE